jgi:hypothetical protein
MGYDAAGLGLRNLAFLIFEFKARICMYRFMIEAPHLPRKVDVGHERSIPGDILRFDDRFVHCRAERRDSN